MSPVLVDTSVWIDFLRRGNEALADLLSNGEVHTHPLVIGELSVGNISGRDEFLALVRELPTTKECTHEEVGGFIEQHRLFGKGLGYMDVHMLCSAVLTDTTLWTLDSRLQKVARSLIKTR